ncbi:MAG: nucleotidyl transferase AbiEii/AbiGii toxin family protein [Acidimicrobiia bacterium]|nr:nucleotidyl transferase AbiEii/AbiGii toxin family protein [Acidimicrobiia bacterium]
MPWPAEDQVEQDLVLSRLIIEVASHPLLGDELVFRGGTCLHKVVLPTPLRYSEDLDYVRASHGPIGPILDAIREIADGLEMEINTDVRSFPKARLRAPFESGSGPMRVKVEINTYETSPARPHHRTPYRLDSSWWSGGADVLTFQPEELVATKLRALFQRKKGRDLFDLWLALTVLGLDPAQIVACFDPYRPDGYTSERARHGLEEHLADDRFRGDLLPLVGDLPVGYDPDVAGALVAEALLEIV